jgi:hypothetical protein
MKAAEKERLEERRRKFEMADKSYKIGALAILKSEPLRTRRNRTRAGPAAERRSRRRNARRLFL